MNKELTREVTIVINMDECREHMERKKEIIGQIRAQLAEHFGEDLDLRFVDQMTERELSIGYRMDDQTAFEQLSEVLNQHHRELVKPSLFKFEKPVEPWREKRRKPWRKRR